MVLASRHKSRLETLAKNVKIFCNKDGRQLKRLLWPPPPLPLYRQLRTDNYLSRARGLSRRRNCCVKCFICCDEFSWHCWLIWPAFVVAAVRPRPHLLPSACLPPYTEHKGCTEIKSKEYAAPLLQSALCAPHCCCPGQGSMLLLSLLLLLCLVLVP